jgi:hypothetical protein
MKKDCKWFINVGESNIFGFYGFPVPRSSPSEEIFASKRIWGKVFGLVGSNSKMTAGELVVFYKLLSGSNSFCSRNKMSEILQCRVNMAPTKHHPVIKHPSCANQHWWMVTILSCKHLNECNPMAKHPILKKYVQSFHIIQMKSFFWVCNYEYGESNNNIKKHNVLCSHVWLWERISTLYV